MNLDLGKFSAEFVENQMDHATFEKVMLWINAVLTFLFGFTYGGEIVPGLPGFVSNVASGLMCTIFFDYAANRWDAKTSAEGSSQKQLTTAGRLRWLGLISSTAVSLLYLALSMSLIEIGPESLNNIGFASTLLVGLVAGANFLGIYIYRSQSPEILEAKRKAGESAAAAAVEFHNKELISKVRLNGKVQATQLIAKHVMKNIQDEAPAIAKAETEELMDEWKREWNSFDADDFNVSDADVLADEVARENEAAPTPPEKLEPLDIDLTPGPGDYIPVPGPEK